MPPVHFIGDNNFNTCFTIQTRWVNNAKNAKLLHSGERERRGERVREERERERERESERERGERESKNALSDLEFLPLF